MKKKKISLATQILIGFFAGFIFGAIVGKKALVIYPLGDLFLRLITMVVVPLVFFSLFSSTAGLGDLKKIGFMGFSVVLYYIVTTAIAISIGLFLANVVRPGERISEATKQKLFKGVEAGKVVQKIEEIRPSLTETLVNIVPKNPAKALAEGNMLQIIFFAIMLGVAIVGVAHEKRLIVVKAGEGLSDAMIEMVHLIMKIAPYAVFALGAGVVAKYGIGILKTLALYSLVVLLGLFLHGAIILSFFLLLLGRMNPIKFFRDSFKVMVFAFSTSSSNATLPITMETAEQKFGVPRYISSFVLPLGATINMNGTALYQGVAAVFIAQAYGIPLTISDQLTIVLTATLAAIGTAGVPGVGLIMLTMVLTAVHVPIEGIALIIGVDRFLDMARTIINVIGDLSAAVIMKRFESKFNRLTEG